MVRMQPVQPVEAPEAKTDETIFATFEVNKMDVNKVLEYYHEWIITSVQRQVPRYLIPAHAVDDLIQAILISFWFRLVSEQVQIVSPKAYIGSIVHSRCVDMIRLQQKHKRVQSLSIGQDDRSSQSSTLLTLSDEMQDPTLEYGYKELIAEVVEAVLELPACQRYAMICLLKDEVKEASFLAEAFGKHGIDIAAVNWPQDASALQSLRSSLSIARKKFRFLRDKSATDRGEHYVI
jgi:DNA-directed RNA polymerase specialized sigma24 family protein